MVFMPTGEIHQAKVPLTPVNVSMMRFLYFTLNKNKKEIDAIINYACFGIIFVEISPAGAFLRRVFYGWVQYEK